MSTNDTPSLPDLVREAMQVLAPERRPRNFEERLSRYTALLLERNREVNLVSRRDTLKHVGRFLRECLFLARLLEEERATLGGRPPQILDIGSGNGFPGIVLEIAAPDAEILLVEATRKKADFLSEVAAALGLASARIVWARAEDLAKGESARNLRHRFDWVTGKGLGSLRDSCALAEPFLAPRGVHWTFKGRACQEELQAASGLFRQRGFALHRLEAISGSEASWVVGVRRLEKPR